jgi:hypothetical protein
LHGAPGNKRSAAILKSFVSVGADEGALDGCATGAPEGALDGRAEDVGVAVGDAVGVFDGAEETDGDVEGVAVGDADGDGDAEGAADTVGDNDGAAEYSPRKLRMSFRKLSWNVSGALMLYTFMVNWQGQHCGCPISISQYTGESDGEMARLDGSSASIALGLNSPSHETMLLGCSWCTSAKTPVSKPSQTARVNSSSSRAELLHGPG